MATSTLIDNIVVNNPKLLEDYVAFMEAQENAPVTPRPEPTARYITDPDEMREILLRGIEIWGKKK